jgi:homogentisate 1,2-dioxygenase
MGEEGFSSDSSLLYHQGLPSAIVAAEVWTLADQATTPNHPLIPRHLQPHRLAREEQWSETDVVTGRRLLLGNGDVRIAYAVGKADSPLYRNALGDEAVFVESGEAIVETVFGALQARPGDYVIIPASTTHRWLPQGDDPLRIYAIEASSHITPPKRYLSRYGQLLEHAPYCERDITGPSEPLIAHGSDVEVLVKHRLNGTIAGTRFVYPEHPFDVVGWDGCLYPHIFSVHDYEPLTGRVHQPPPSHQVFEGDNFVICNFVPRMVDYHPLSIPVPYFHSNVDSDEVMFYCAGDYSARAGSGIGVGSISVHPGGHAHGPHPGAYERSVGTKYVDELAVMVDTFRPLELGEGGLACEDPSYAWSWAPGAAGRG